MRGCYGGHIRSIHGQILRGAFRIIAGHCAAVGDGTAAQRPSFLPSFPSFLPPSFQLSDQRRTPAHAHQHMCTACTGAHGLGAWVGCAWVYVCTRRYDYNTTVHGTLVLPALTYYGARLALCCPKLGLGLGLALGLLTYYRARLAVCFRKCGAFRLGQIGRSVPNMGVATQCGG